MGQKNKQPINYQVVIIGILVLFLIVGVPFIINECYKAGAGYITMWGASEVLSYYGAVLASVGAIFGVYFSIKAAYKNYQEDVRARVLPFIAVTPFGRKAAVNTAALLEEYINGKPETSEQQNKAVIYEEFKLERIYFVITSDGIKASRTLEKSQQEILSHAGAKWITLANGADALQYIDYFSIPVEIENVGNGTAVALRIGFNRNSGVQHKYVYPMMLKQGQTLYIHIFSTEPFEIVGGEYTLEFYYEDIYGNKYVQKFPIKFEKDESGREYQSIDTVGKQTNYIGEDLNAHT